MAESNSQDRAPNHDAVIAAYSPEMVGARDQLVADVENLRQQLAAMDAVGQLPPSTGYQVYEDGTSVVDLGRFSSDRDEARAQHQEDKAFEELTGTPVSRELMVVTISGTTAEQATDPGLPPIEQPIIKIGGSTKQGDQTAYDALSIYESGYVEVDSETVRAVREHPEDASELAKAYGTPTVLKEEVVEPATQKPADLEDVTAAATKLKETATRYGINL